VRKFFSAVGRRSLCIEWNWFMYQTLFRSESKTIFESICVKRRVIRRIRLNTVAAWDSWHFSVTGRWVSVLSRLFFWRYCEKYLWRKINVYCFNRRRKIWRVLGMWVDFFYARNCICVGARNIEIPTEKRCTLFLTISQNL